MTSGAHTANNGDLAFVSRCSVPDLFVACASNDLRCTVIQRHVCFVDIIDSVRRFHQIILKERVFQQVEVFIHGLFVQSILTLAVGSPL